MYKIKNPNQGDLFDPWEFLTPKRRQLLESGWPGLFREHILPSIPVDKVAKYFDATCGRPTKELYAIDTNHPVELKTPKQIPSDSL